MTISTTESAQADTGPGGPAAGYGPGAFYFSDGCSTMLCGPGSPVAAGVPAAESVDAVRRALAGAGPEARVVGAVPFDTTRPAHLMAAPAARIGDAPRPRPAAPVARGDLNGFRVTARPGPSGHMDAVRAGLAALADDPQLRKLVLARTLELRRAEPLDPAAVLEALLARHPHAYTFAAPLAGGATLVGASPELLVERRGHAVRTCPLAGSAARAADPREDRRRAEALRASAKDRIEHAIVVEDIAARLRPLCRDLDVPAEPVLVSTPTMWHLATPITGTVAAPATGSLDLALALHPTPAICGTPTAAARGTIGRIERFDRGFYTGLVGWCDAAGDGQWAIAIRCAEVAPGLTRLFAGGGIVDGSDPAAELAETSAKLQTMVDAVHGAAPPG